MKRIISLTLTIFLCLILILPSLTSCDEKIEEEPKATFTSTTKMFASDGISVIMDASFTKYYPDDCALACENGDLKFEAFALEKYYFTENGRDAENAKDALEYVNPGKDAGASVELNHLWQPYVEFLAPDPAGTNNQIRMYYFCIEDDEVYWFCTFFSYDKNFEEYRDTVMSYLETVSPHKASKND